MILSCEHFTVADTLDFPLHIGPVGIRETTRFFHNPSMFREFVPEPPDTILGRVLIPDIFTYKKMFDMVVSLEETDFSISNSLEVVSFRGSLTATSPDTTWSAHIRLRFFHPLTRTRP